MKMRKTFALIGLFALLIGIQGLAVPNWPFTLNRANAANIDVWWPTDGVVVSGTTPLKALLQDWSVQDYNMFWSVDGGSWNWMDSNWQDWPHKETQVDFSGWDWKGSGPYNISFIATDLDGNDIVTRTVAVYVDPGVEQSAPEPEPEVQSEPEPEPVSVETTRKDRKKTKTASEPSTDTSAASNTGSPFTRPLYVDPNHPAKWQAEAWRDSYSWGAAMLDKIADKPGAKWFGGWNGDIFNDVKSYVDEVAGAGALPVMIAYNIPQRDCGSYSAGGAGSPEAYRSWIGAFASAIGDREAVVVLEPDALSGMDCLSWNDRQARTSLLREAVNAFNAQENTSVYIDAGHSSWHSAEEMANRLKQAGVDASQGFALNVSNYFWTQDNVNYGISISSLTGGKHFVVDTSRNGNGPTPDHQWCNPSGRALGQPPTTNTGNSLVDAFLWLKVPGESDGTCNGGPSAGHFWAEYAVGLAERASW